MYAESIRAFLKPVIKYLDDASVSEIMINGPTEVWIEAKGRLTLTDAKFTEEGLLGASRNIAQFVGRMLNEERPRLDARLPDGSRIHIVIAPIARKGTTVSIRKFFKDKLTIDKLIAFGSMSPQMAYLIQAMVHTKLNILVAGGTGSGKTTLLNIVSTLIPDDERILTIEDSAELQLQQSHIVPFESRPPDKFGKGEVNMGHLLHSALRLRPDRIVVGEVRGGEAFDLMQAMNTGHGGSMATTHANTPTDTLRRIESLCLQSGIDLPMVAVRSQVASAINAVVTCERFHDGSRRTTTVAEVLPLNEKGDYRTVNLFVYAPTHKDAEGHIHGYHTPTGMLPTFLGRMRSHGFNDIDEAFFDPATYGVPPPPSFLVENYTTQWAPSLKHRERGEADSKDLAEMINRAAEYAKAREVRHKALVAEGTMAEGYSLGSEHKPRDLEWAKKAKPSGSPAPAEAKESKPAEAAKPPEPKPAPAAPATPVEPQRPVVAASPQKAETTDAEEATHTQPGPRPSLPAPAKTAEGAAEDSGSARPPVPRAAPLAAKMPVTAPRAAPASPVRRPEAKVEVGGDLSSEVSDDEKTPPPGPAPTRPTSNLPPGKRPLPVRGAAPVTRRPDPLPPSGDEPEDEQQGSGDRTMVRQSPVPDRFRR
jgi:pilus assembly protein CpaF